MSGCRYVIKFITHILSHHRPNFCLLYCIYSFPNAAFKPQQKTNFSAYFYLGGAGNPQVVPRDVQEDFKGDDYFVAGLRVPVPQQSSWEGVLRVHRSLFLPRRF